MHALANCLHSLTQPHPVAVLFGWEGGAEEGVKFPYQRRAYPILPLFLKYSEGGGGI